MAADAGFILIPALGVLAPLLARSVARWLPIPIIVFELLLGIAVGPNALGWVDESEFVATLSNMGLAMLFFVAGSEIDFGVFRGRSGRRAVGGWLVSLVLAIAVAFVVTPSETALFIGIALSSTALGTLLPILRDSGELQTPFGKTIAAIGAVGEFGPLVAISILLGSRSPGPATIVLAVFLVIVGVAVWFASRASHGRLHALVNATLHTSGQYAIRVLILILVALVALSVVLDLDMLLGAFAAGVLWQLIMRDADESDREQVESKVEAVAFGVFVPIFFIYTGVTFDLGALLADPVLFAAVPVIAVILLLVRGLPSMISAPAGSPTRDRLAVALLGATGLPIIVAVTGIGVSAGAMTTTQASVLVAGGMLSVLLFPLLAMGLRHRRIDADAVAASERL